MSIQNEKKFIERVLITETITLFKIKGLPEINQETDLIGEIINKFTFEDDDIVIISSKAISKWEGNVVYKKDITPSCFAKTLSKRIHHDEYYCELVLRESKDIVRMSEGVVITRTKHGFVLANSGVDASNSGESDKYILLPLEPDKTAKKIRNEIKLKTKKEIGVIISDTFGRTWRVGETDLAIGVSGINPLADFKGQKDHNGRELNFTKIAKADEICSAAELLKGKTNGVPVVVLRGLNLRGEGEIKDTLMPEERDLFR